MNKRTYPIASYPPKEIINEFNVPDDTSPLALSVKDLETSFALTPKMPSEDNCPLFTVSVTKEIFETNSNKTLVKLSKGYTYKLVIDDSINPEPFHLFEKIDESVMDFAKHYFKLTDKTRFHTHSQIKKLNQEEYIVELERRIDFWEDSIRQLKVDNEGKPLDND